MSLAYSLTTSYISHCQLDLECWVLSATNQLPSGNHFGFSKKGLTLSNFCFIFSDIITFTPTFALYTAAFSASMRAALRRNHASRNVECFRWYSCHSSGDASPRGGVHGTNMLVGFSCFLPGCSRCRWSASKATSGFGQQQNCRQWGGRWKHQQHRIMTEPTQHEPNQYRRLWCCGCAGSVAQSVCVFVLFEYYCQGHWITHQIDWPPNLLRTIKLNFQVCSSNVCVKVTDNGFLSIQFAAACDWMHVIWWACGSIINHHLHHGHHHRLHHRCHTIVCAVCHFIVVLIVNIRIVIARDCSRVMAWFVMPAEVAPLFSACMFNPPVLHIFVCLVLPSLTRRLPWFDIQSHYYCACATLEHEKPGNVWTLRVGTQWMYS